MRRVVALGVGLFAVVWGPACTSAKTSNASASSAAASSAANAAGSSSLSIGSAGRSTSPSTSASPTSSSGGTSSPQSTSGAGSSGAMSSSVGSTSSTAATGSTGSSGSSGSDGGKVLDGVEILVPLTLSRYTVSAGQTVTATATLYNPTSAAITLEAADIAGRPPGGTNASGPFLDFLDGPGTTLQPGQSFVVTGTRTFTATDPLGSWYAYVTLEDSSGAYHDSSNDVTFTVVAAASTSNSSSSGGSSSGSTGTSSRSSSASTSGSSGTTTGSSGTTGTNGGDGGFYNLGMNMPSLNYYDNAAIYADMTLQMAGNSGRWDAEDGSGAAPLDATGAPTVAAWAGVSGAFPSGSYSVSWDGTGSISVQGLGTPTVTSSNGVQHNSATLNWSQQLSSDTSPAWVQFKATPPVTNIHILAPASVASSSGFFLSDLLLRLRPFSTLRFMDALNTNGNLVQSWSERTWPSEGSRAGTAQGMAYEDIIALANEAHKDVWINVPSLATDDYVCRLARLFRYGEGGASTDGGAACDPSAPAGTATSAPLNGSSRVYVEYSNEIWNWGFQQIEDVYCMVWGMPDKTTDGKHCDVTAPTSAIGAAALANTSLPWDSSNTYGKAGQFTMILEKRQSDIFREVFGCASGNGCQAQIPMNVQAAYAAEADEGFKFLVSAYGSASAVDEMAVAPYFNTEADSDDATVDGIFSDLQTVLATSPPASNGSATVNWLEQDLTEAALYGLPVIAYEGGQALNSGDNTANTISAQSDPRMYTDTQAYFELWGSLVGRAHLFNYYSFVGSYGSYGCWGALVNQDDPGTQKWDALMSLTRPAGDANLDGVVNAQDCAILQAHYGQSGQWWMEGDFNHDGTVDATDLMLMNANIQGPACTAP